MAKNKKSGKLDERTDPLFAKPDQQPVQMRPGTYGIWTENKARLIDRYLKTFVWITRHGTYIDGFAGPKSPKNAHTWSAGRVVAAHPADPKKRRVRHFHLCDNNPDQIKRLQKLKDRNPGKDVVIHEGDFNESIDAILPGIKPKEATFCLLDQFSTECSWATVQKLAAHPKHEYKIELFYFLMNGWLPRTIAAAGDDVLRRWWGRDDFRSLRGMQSWDRGQLMEARFRDELGYKYATAWPIRDELKGRARIMFFMVHASDHDDAPLLMRRANEAVMRPVTQYANVPMF